MNHTPIYLLAIWILLGPAYGLSQASPTDSDNADTQIRQVVVEGSSSLTADDLAGSLSLQVGSNYTNEAAQADFEALQALYEARGYLIGNTPAFSFEAGRYTQRVTELSVNTRNVVFLGRPEAEGGPPSMSPTGATEPDFILKYLPDSGDLYQADAIANAKAQLTALNAFLAVEITPEVSDEGVDLTVQVFEVPNNILLRLEPVLGVELDSGRAAFFELGVKYTQPQLFGRAHSASAAGIVYTTDNGTQFGGELSYTIPWLELNLFDFQDNPTSFTVSAYSLVDANIALRADGLRELPHPCVAAGTCDDDDDNAIRVGETTQRTTGLRLDLARNLSSTTQLATSLRFELIDYDYETGEACEFEADGNLDGGCDLSEADASSFTEQDGGFIFLDTQLSRDTRDDPSFASRGYYASARAGIGFGDDYRNRETLEQDSYLYVPLELGLRGYFTPLADSQVLALRVNAGTALSDGLPYARLFNVGDNNDFRYQLRGYSGDDILPTQNYVTSSVEYRVNVTSLGLDIPLTERFVVYGFADTGLTSNDFGGDDPGLHVGAGAGALIQLRAFGISAPPIRFNYGFSEANSSGVFSVAVGDLF
ncbi:MAG: BamA/TamA family outer membrane protein [Deinococcota bacterium]